MVDPLYFLIGNGAATSRVKGWVRARCYTTCEMTKGPE